MECESDADLIHRFQRRIEAQPPGCRVLGVGTGNAHTQQHLNSAITFDLTPKSLASLISYNL